MPQIFHKNYNYQVKTAIVGILLFVTVAFTAAFIWYSSGNVTGQGNHVVQPVQFTHEHHVSGLGLDCRYCHFDVERSNFSTVPPTKVCMTCHSQMYTEEQMLEPVRESWKTDMPIKWVRVHNLSDFVYFNHSAHVNKGIGCAECHGRVDQMGIVYQAESLHMAWCLQCHFDPTKHVRPKDQITNMTYEHPTSPDQKIKVGDKQMTQAELAKQYHVQSKVNCSTCHR